MSDEIFDVVNERDEVTGQERRSEVHRRGLRHRAVHVLIFNRRGELFLQKRSASKDTFPGAWDSSASGHLNPGEDYDSGAARELREELGCCTIAPLERLFKIDACVQSGQEFVWVYRGQAEGPFLLHPEEIERGGWFRTDEVSRWVRAAPGDFARAFVHLWEEVVRHGPGRGPDSSPLVPGGGPATRDA